MSPTLNGDPAVSGATGASGHGIPCSEDAQEERRWEGRFTEGFLCAYDLLSSSLVGLRGQHLPFRGEDAETQGDVTAEGHPANQCQS